MSKLYSLNTSLFKITTNCPDLDCLCPHVNNECVNMVKKNMDQRIETYTKYAIENLSLLPEYIDVLKEYEEYISWDSFCQNEHPDIIPILKKYPEKINWRLLCHNTCTEVIEFIGKNINKVTEFDAKYINYYDDKRYYANYSDTLSDDRDISNLSEIQLIAKYGINYNHNDPGWVNLCANKNPAVIPIIKKNIYTAVADFDCLDILCRNPNAISIMDEALEITQNFDFSTSFSDPEFADNILLELDARLLYLIDDHYYHLNRSNRELLINLINQTHEKLESNELLSEEEKTKNSEFFEKAYEILCKDYNIIEEEQLWKNFAAYPWAIDLIQKFESEVCTMAMDALCENPHKQAIYMIERAIQKDKDAVCDCLDSLAKNKNPLSYPIFLKECARMLMDKNTDHNYINTALASHPVHHELLDNYLLSTKKITFEVWDALIKNENAIEFIERHLELLSSQDFSKVPTCDTSNYELVLHPNDFWYNLCCYNENSTPILIKHLDKLDESCLSSLPFCGKEYILFDAYLEKYGKLPVLLWSFILEYRRDAAFIEKHFDTIVANNQHYYLLNNPAALPIIKKNVHYFTDLSKVILRVRTMFFNTDLDEMRKFWATQIFVKNDIVSSSPSNENNNNTVSGESLPDELSLSSLEEITKEKYEILQKRLKKEIQKNKHLVIENQNLIKKKKNILRENELLTEKVCSLTNNLTTSSSKKRMNLF